MQIARKSEGRGKFGVGEKSEIDEGSPPSNGVALFICVT